MAGTPSSSATHDSAGVSRTAATAVKTTTICTTPSTARPGGRAVEERVGQHDEQLPDQQDAGGVVAQRDRGPGSRPGLLLLAAASISLACLRSSRLTSAATISRLLAATRTKFMNANALTMSGQGKYAPVAPRRSRPRSPSMTTAEPTKPMKASRRSSRHLSSARFWISADDAATSGTSRATAAAAGPAPGRRPAPAARRASAPARVAAVRSSYSSRSSRPSANASVSSAVDDVAVGVGGAQRRRRRGRAGRAGRTPTGHLSALPHRNDRTRTRRLPCLSGVTREPLRRWTYDKFPQLGVGAHRPGPCLVGPKREHVLFCGGRRTMGR